MILGLSLHAFTQFHVAISLVGIATGLLVTFAMINGRELPKTNALFLLTTILTSVTGFFFPFHGMTPGIKLGIVSLVVLLIALIARGAGWPRTYAYTAVLALYLNGFVFIVQSFEKVPSLHTLAPTGQEPPFKIAQALALIVFLMLGFLAGKGVRRTA